MFFHQYVCLILHLFVSLFVRLSIRFFIHININMYRIFCPLFLNWYPASDQITGNLRIFFLHSVLYCVLSIYDAGCDNRNQWPRRGHHRAPGRHYQNFKKIQKFSKIFKNFQKQFLSSHHPRKRPKMHFCTQKVQDFLNLWCLPLQNFKNRRRLH